MKKYLPLVLSALFPLVCSGATPWQKWDKTYIRLQDDGNVACVKRSDNINCNWALGDTVPAATADALVCGAEHKVIWGKTGYDQPNHWCNNAYGDLFATWRRGDYFGFNMFIAQNAVGDLMCASNNGTDCAWDNLVDDRYPERPVKPLVCGAAHDAVWGVDTSKVTDHWCQQARYTVAEVDFSDPKWATERFDYGAGWAGVGFGLSGTQRGAPESMSIGIQEGRKGLALLSQDRTDTWKQSVFNGTPKGMYATADIEWQDDLFMYSKSPWVAAEMPAVVMHVYLPKGNTTSLRMPVTFQRLGVNATRWPGIWIKPDGISLRTVKSDFQLANLVTSGSIGSWWTLGLKVTADGDLEYYATPDWRISPFDASLLRGKQSLLLGDSSYKIISQADASVMISSVIRNSSPIVIGDIRYAKIGTVQMDTPDK